MPYKGAKFRATHLTCVSRNFSLIIRRDFSKCRALSSTSIDYTFGSIRFNGATPHPPSQIHLNITLEYNVFSRNKSCSDSRISQFIVLSKQCELSIFYFKPRFIIGRQPSIATPSYEINFVRCGRRSDNRPLTLAHDM